MSNIKLCITVLDAAVHYPRLDVVCTPMRLIDRYHQAPRATFLATMQE